MTSADGTEDAAAHPFAKTPPAPARRPRGRVGRPKGRDPEVTRTAILDAAERPFADGGYDGTSLRHVAAAAGVQLAVLTYHYGPEEALFEAVVGRRATIMTKLRRDALSEAMARAGGGRPSSTR